MEEIPAAPIVTDLFVETGKAMAAAWGVPEYPFGVMRHPIANLTEAELDARAREVLPQIVSLLLEGRR